MEHATYRISTNRLAVVAIAAFFVLAGVFYQQSDQGRVPGDGWVPVVVAAVPLAVIVIWVWRMGTVVRPDYLGTRGLLRTRKMAWRDIQDIRIELNETHIVKESAPAECVRVYLGTGKKVTLPHLNQKNLNGHPTHGR